MCAWAPGSGGNCNDWTTSSGFELSVGEWFVPLAAKDMYNDTGVTFGAVTPLVFHFAADTKYDGKTLNPCAMATGPIGEAFAWKIGCPGCCGSSNRRAIPCCAAPCGC